MSSKRNMQGGYVNYVAMAEDIKAAIGQLKKLTSKAFEGKQGVDLEGFGKVEALVSKDPKKWTADDLMTANELLHLHGRKK